jgi:hypothetical protein
MFSIELMEIQSFFEVLAYKLDQELKRGRNFQNSAGMRTHCTIVRDNLFL